MISWPNFLTVKPGLQAVYPQIINYVFCDISDLFQRAELKLNFIFSKCIDEGVAVTSEHVVFRCRMGKKAGEK